MLQSPIIDLAYQKTWKSNLKRKYIQTRKALIFCEEKYKCYLGDEG